MVLSAVRMSSEEENSENDEDIKGNPGMADAMLRVLKMGKNSQKNVVLSKAKLVAKPAPTANAVKYDFEVEKTNDNTLHVDTPTNDDSKPVVKEIKKKKMKKQYVAPLGRIKPSPLDRNKERSLSKIATSGVVKLFNTVREQQKFIEKKLEAVGPSETKKEKVLKSIDKRTFLDVLMGQSTKTEPKQEGEIKTENEDEDDPTSGWSVLREDFMMGAKLKDWDKAEQLDEGTKPKRAKVS